MKISIRNAKFAKIGLQDMIDYMNQFIDVKESIMVEVGSYVGDSTKIFAESFKEVHCIDPWKNGYDDNDAASYQHDMSIIEKQFDEDILNVYNNVYKYKTDSITGSRNFKHESLDFVYIDGLHTYGGVKKDINTWLSKIKKNSFIGGHDYQGKFQGTIQAVDEFKKPDKIFKDTSWIIKL